MRAREIAEDYPVVTLSTGALDAVRLMAEHRLPGLVVTGANGTPTTILPASQVVRLVVPHYVQDDPALAGVLSESMADRIVDKLGRKTVADVLPQDPPRAPTVNHDDTIVEVAAVMAQQHSPLVAVLDRAGVVGIITASRLLQVALQRR